MQLPNKLYSYKSSSLAFMPMVLEEIKGGSVPVGDLYRKIRPLLDDATDFIDVMDCLYTLNAADVNDDGEVFICL